MPQPTWPVESIISREEQLGVIISHIMSKPYRDNLNPVMIKSEDDIFNFTGFFIS